jgi:hypothetical protein
MRTHRLWVALVAALAALLSTTGVAAPVQAATGTAAIKGQVLAWMDPLGDARVTVYSARTGVSLRSVMTDGDGYYEVTALPATGIKVRASKPGYLDAWAGGNTKATATVYQLQPGQVLEQSWDPMVLYLDLTPEAVVTGTVQGTRGSAGASCTAPLRNVKVTVVSAETGAVLGTDRTDAAGAFRVGMLRAGQVKLKASKAGWVTTWAPNASSSSSAQAFELLAYFTTDAGMITMTSKHRRACAP